MNMMNAEEFPGSLRGTTNLQRIPEEMEADVESLRNTSKFEGLDKPSENTNPNKSLDNSHTFKLDGTMITDPKLKKGSHKIENFEGFPELPEYEGIQKEYLNTSKYSQKKEDIILEDPLEGTAGTVGTAKSIDFDELQQKLTEKTGVSSYNPPEMKAANPDRKKWGKGDINPPKPKEDKLEALRKEMEGIDELLEQFTPKDGK